MLEELRRKVCLGNKGLEKHGLVIFTWGNLSEIDSGTGIVAIKPSGVSFSALRPEDIVLLDLEGKAVEGSKRPSSDTPTHLEIYRAFPEVKAIVHTHSTHATAFAQAMREIDCFGTTHADHFHGSVPVTRILSEKEISEGYEANTGKVIVECLKKRGVKPLEVPACLVAGHGPFVFGSSAEKAVENAVVLEQVAGMNLETIKLEPGARPISQALLDKHFLRKHGKNAYYGQPEAHQKE